MLVHEVGHFVTARRAGVRVHEFGIGFPPRARVLRNDGETLYTLNWLPIGGFVKLEGEDGDYADDPRSFTRSAVPDQAGHPHRRRRDEPGARVGDHDRHRPVGAPAGLDVGTVQAGSPAAEAGLLAGDQLVAIDGVYYDRFDGGQAMVTDLRARAGESVRPGRHPRETVRPRR